MTKLIKLFSAIIILMQLFSCTPSAPYEMKSPCVATEFSGEEAIIPNPCVRKPVNFNRDIS